MSRILVTGATGFVGRTLVESLGAAGHGVVAAVRGSPAFPLPSGVDVCRVGDIGPTTNWTDALKGVDAIAHLAGLAHVLRETSPDPLNAFLRVNTEGTRRLAEQAAASGVGRFVFMSSIKVNGEMTTDRPFTETDDPAPTDPYSISKTQAEEALHTVATDTSLEVAILRPTLVYGEGVKGNFRSLLRWCQRARPVPVPRVANARSLIYVGNLADAIVRCLSHPRAPAQTYLLRDGEDVSTAELVRRICEALGVRPRVLRIPTRLLRTAGRLSGRPDAISRLMSSLTVDDKKIRKELDWRPPFTMQQGLARTTTWFRSELGNQEHDVGTTQI